jgi:hypothetical protein
MLTRLFSRASSRRDVPDIPDVRDFPGFPERVDLPQRPSTPEGERPRRNVWDMTTGKGRRVELEP